jgi:hypothetical protein
MVLGMLSVCLYLRKGASLVPERLDGFCSDFIFKSSSIIGRCPMNLNIPAPKIKALQAHPRTQNGCFLENGSNEYYYISLIWGNHIPKWNRIAGISRKITASVLGAKRRNIDFVKIDVTGWTDFFVVRYSKTNNGLSSNSRFRFLDKVAQVSRTYVQRLCTDIF